MSAAPDDSAMRAQVREVITRARSAVTAMEQLPDAAPDAPAREWADLIALGARERWTALVRFVREGHAGNFIGTVQSITAQGRPVDEGPPNVASEAAAIDTMLDDLALALNRLTDPHYSRERSAFDDAMFPRLSAALRAVDPA